MHAADFTSVGFVVAPAALGWFGFVATETGIRQLTFGHTSAERVRAALGRKEDVAAQPDWMADAVERLQQYLSGEPVDLGDLPVDLPAGTPFERRVRQQLAGVGYGRTTTYGELADAAGAPRAARAVGNIMARNPVPLVIPCHRVLAAGGRLGGYSAPSGLSMKRQLLEMERTAAIIGASVAR